MFVYIIIVSAVAHTYFTPFPQRSNEETIRYIFMFIFFILYIIFIFFIFCLKLVTFTATTKYYQNGERSHALRLQELKGDLKTI